MKKFGLFKRIGLSATAFFVCLAVLISCFTFLPRFAFAEGEEGTTTPTTVKVNDGKAFATSDDDVALKSSYTYGDIITVPAGATVVLPNGKDATVTDGKVEATMLGVYKIRYTDATSGVQYDFKTSVTLDEEYFLYIKYNGADIPTYVESTKDSSFTLPEASVMFYNEQNILTPYPGKYAVTIEDSLGNKYTDSKTFDPSDKQGKVFITYTATLEDNGTKRLPKTFTVNVQSKVTSGGNPTLAVSGIQKDASVNRPFTLPVANVSDKNDDNVKVVIEVFEPDGKTKVHNVKVNDDGYAVETLDSEVEFDNDKSMTFYPTTTGKYKVQYTAYNDSYNKDNPTAGGKSSTYESIIEVADHVAPVFKNTDNYEYLIPETWGLSVANEDGTVKDLGGTITFKVPEVVDNKDYASAADAPEGKKDDLITMLFRITDSDNNKTILEIPNILSTGDDSKLKNNGIYDADVEFNAEHEFKFEFSKYKRKDKNDSEVTKALPGTYTVLFRARDKANNTSSKTYTITLKDKYEDKSKPSTAEVTAPEYLSEADESFTVPYPVYADGDDTRPQLTYRIYSAANKFLDVKGGEEAKLVRDGGLTLVINEGMDSEATMTVDGDSLYFYVGVKDKVGNYRTNAVDDEGNYIYLSDNDENYTKVTAVTKLIGASEDGKKFGYDGSKINFANAKDGETIKAGDSVNAGSFVITAAGEDMRYYTGFEVAVYDPEDNYLDVTLQTLSDVESDGTVKIYVKDITFTTSSAALGDDHYTMTVRVFDVNGNYEVYAYQLGGVLNAKGDGVTTSAIANIGKTGNVNVTYKLNNSVIKNIQEEGTFRVIRKISGGIFSVMGNELTAYTAGSYTIQDGYINANDINGGVFNYDDVKDKDGNVVTKSPVKFDSVNKGIHYVDIADTAKPVIELLDKAPVYENVYDEKKGEIAEGNGLITVPEAIAYTENGMGTVKIDVTDPDGSDDVDWDEETRTFHATKNGVYTVTYTATYESAASDPFEIKINVGDVTAPRFTVSGGTSTAGTKKEGDTFTFKTLNLLEGESSDGVQIRKELYYNNEILSTNTVSGSYSGYASKGNNGTEIKLNKVGEYTIVYTAKDEYGNEYKITETVTVTSKGSSSPTTWTTLSTVLIIVAIVLLAGVIVYVVRFRKVKK